MTLSLEVLRVGAPAWVQDGGRVGHLHQGVPVGGALIPELLALSNRALGNSALEAGLEAYAEMEFLARTAGMIAVDGRTRGVQSGERFRIERPTRSRASYLALPGGIDVPSRLDGFGTLDVVGLGGFEGRALRRGDLLRSRAVSHPAIETPPGQNDDWLDRPIRIVLGPDHEAFAPHATAVLEEGAFVISPSSSRVGTRLVGPALPRRGGDAGTSAPMLIGALQVPSSGEPIILGPDHPTLGGYPVIAVVVRADCGALFARRPGTPVHFKIVDVASARAISARWAETWTT